MGAVAHAELQGPASLSYLPQITLRGNSYQRGLQYGRELAAHTERFYDWFVRQAPAELLTATYRAVLDDMEQMSARHFPQLLEFVRGWSDGARVTHEKCRIMAFHNEIRNVLRTGCSNLLVTAAEGGAWLGRNCDLYEAERSWQVQVTCLADDCYAHAGVTYLGLPLGAGVNSAGLALGGASLPCLPPEVLKGMPNLIPYLLWTQRAVGDCVERIEALGFLGKGANLVLLDAEGRGAVVEMGSGRHIVRYAGEEGYLVATNHSVSAQLQRPAGLDPQHLESSRARYSRLAEILASAAPTARGVELGYRALADRQGPWPVCERIRDGFHTIYSTVIQPRAAQSRLALCWGYPDERPYADLAIWP